MKSRLEHLQMLMRYSHSNKHKQSNTPTLREKWKFTMSSEHLTPQSSEQPLQRTGTSFENNDQIDLRASGLESLEIQRARAEVIAATTASPQQTQTLEKQVESQLEYAPLKQHEVIALLGRKVVFKLRKSYQEDNLDLENDEPAPYVFSPQTTEPGQYIVPQEASATEAAEAILESAKRETHDEDTKGQFGLAA
jgi:hypothetical protein